MAEIVLQHFANSSNDDTPPLPKLPKKLATLLAPAVLMRVSDLSAIDTTSIVFPKNKCLSHSYVLEKAQRSGPLHQSFTSPRFNDSLVCPVSCFSNYLTGTNAIRLQSSALFLRNNKPYSPVPPSTIGKWIKSCLLSSGIDTNQFSAHSTERVFNDSNIPPTQPILLKLHLNQSINLSSFIQILLEENVEFTGAKQKLK